ncbi:MAG: hypothetical protein ABI222_08975 [Opitutaceae bacterium]
MTFARLLALLGCLAALFARAQAEESNVWPFYVSQHDVAGHVTSWNSGGPFFFSQPSTNPNPEFAGATVSGFRPFWVKTKDVNDQVIESAFLYPIFIYRADRETYSWSIVDLINGSGPREGIAVLPSQTRDETKAFDIWIFYFSRQTGSPETSYRALFPIAGTIKNRFGHDQLSWVLWPLYFRTEKNGSVTTSTPWPFIQGTRGIEHGFAIWPLYGQLDHPERFHRSFFLWPLGWNNTIQPNEDAPPDTPATKQSGFLPFYTAEDRPGYTNRDYLWPFFGYTNDTKPKPYHETRYLWPFLVQGRGQERYVNRWGPIYTHSIIRGMDKTWILWPLWRQAKWQELNVDQQRSQFLYVFYWSQTQHSLSNPQAAPAQRTHVWPLFSKWDNGAGRRQFQLFSPFDVFFPYNSEMSETWTPLFAIYRFDRRDKDNQRWSLLWNAVTWRKDYGEREFHLGPLFSKSTSPQQGRVAVGSGLFGWKRSPGDRRWHFFWFDFSSNVKQAPLASR